jgi:anti-sigma-K factor RskA
MNEEFDIEAGEFVLGTLPAEERARFVERLEAEPSLREAVALWTQRLSPLDDGVAPEQPSLTLWPSIERRARTAASASDT